jgi:hypothetical protein
LCPQTHKIEREVVADRGVARALCNRVVEHADERDETDRRTVIGFSRNCNGTQPMHLSFVKTTLWIGVKRVFTVATARTEVSRLVFDESRAHLTERGATRATIDRVWNNQIDEIDTRRQTG